MRMPNAERAEIDLRKLHDYCLNPHHPRGKHKARVFLSVLAIAQSDSDELRRQILEHVPNANTISGNKDRYGTRFVVDVTINHKGKSAQVRTAWIIRIGEEVPQLTSCYVKE